MSQKALKLTINLVFLSISIFLSTYFMIQLTENTFIRAGIAVFAIGLEAAMQYVLALGKQRWRQGAVKKLTAIVLFVCYAGYVFVYNIPSAVGFFVMEIDAQEQVAAKVELTDTINRQRLEQISRTIDSLNRQLETEAVTGYGSRSKAVMEQLERLAGEQERLQGRAEVAGVTAVTKNVFRSLERVLHVPANILKIVIFGTSIFMLCVILIITSWDLPEETDVTPVKPVTHRPVTKPVTQETAVASESQGVCIVCGEPAKPKSKYCSGKCRTAACRVRKTEAAVR